MLIISVLAAAFAGFAFGAVWYMSLQKPWVEAAGIALDESGKPLNASPLPYALAALAMLIVASAMRYAFYIGDIETFGKGITAGIGVGLFFISPWIMINNAYGNRPFKLTLIDGGYATFGCAVMGAVLTLF